MHGSAAADVRRMISKYWIENYCGASRIKTRLFPNNVPYETRSYSIYIYTVIVVLFFVSSNRIFRRKLSRPTRDFCDVHRRKTDEGHSLFVHLKNDICYERHTITYACTSQSKTVTELCSEYTRDSTGDCLGTYENRWPLGFHRRHENVVRIQPETCTANATRGRMRLVLGKIIGRAHKFTIQLRLLFAT